MLGYVIVVIWLPNLKLSFQATKHAGFQVIEGCFKSPVDLYLTDSLVPEIKEVFFQMVLPNKWPSPDFRPLCIHLAGTGDHVITYKLER